MNGDGYLYIYCVTLWVPNSYLVGKGREGGKMGEGLAGPRVNIKSRYVGTISSVICHTGYRASAKEFSLDGQSAISLMSSVLDFTCCNI